MRTLIQNDANLDVNRKPERALTGKRLAGSFGHGSIEIL